MHEPAAWSISHAWANEPEEIHDCRDRVYAVVPCAALADEAIRTAAGGEGGWAVKSTNLIQRS